MEAKTSEAERLSRGEARLRRRATRALDSLSASEKKVSMRSTALFAEARPCPGAEPTHFAA
jgi:hypothetical protein